jgi:ABC-2 type transport system permease protein
MKSLLAIEWLKIKKYRTFWVLAILFMVLLPVWNYEVATGIINIGGGGKGNGGINFLSTAYQFPDVWGNVGFWASVFVMFLSILVIILTTNEYTFRTNRQNVIDGWKRIDFFHAKVWLILLLSAAATVYLFVMGALFGWSNSGSIKDVFSGIEQVGYFFLLALNYMGFAFFIALWIRKSGLAIGLFLLYALIIENILKFMINHKLDTSYGNLLPLQTSDELLPLPLMKMAQSMLGSSSIQPSTYISVTIVWCLIYYFAGRIMLMRRDW